MNKQGFTLLEMLTVVVIIGILATVALPGYMRSAERARATEAMSAIKALNESISVYFVEKDRCPQIGDWNRLVSAFPTQTNNYRFSMAAPDHVPGTPCNGVSAERNGGGYRYTIWNPYKRAPGSKDFSFQCFGIGEKNKSLCESIGRYGASGTAS